MPIDSSIYSRQIMPDIAGSMQRGMQMSDMMQQKEVRQQEFEKQKAIKDLAESSMTPDVGGGSKFDQERYLSGLYKIDPQKAMQTQQMMQQQQAGQEGLALKQQGAMLDRRKAGFRAVRDDSGKVTGMERDPDYKDPKAQEQQFKMVDMLRKERSALPVTKATQAVSVAYNKIRHAKENPSAAGDLTMVFNFMKMLDPSSVVRESEFKTAAGARAAISKMENSGTFIPAIVKQGMQRMETGRFLLPEQLEDFAGQSAGLYEAQISQQRKADSIFERIAGQRGLDPKNIMIEFGTDVAGKKKKKQQFDVNTLIDLDDKSLDEMYKQAGGE